MIGRRRFGIASCLLATSIIGSNPRSVAQTAGKTRVALRLADHMAHSPKEPNDHNKKLGGQISQPKYTGLYNVLKNSAPGLEKVLYDSATAIQSIDQKVLFESEEKTKRGKALGHASLSRYWTIDLASHSDATSVVNAINNVPQLKNLVVPYIDVGMDGGKLLDSNKDDYPPGPLTSTHGDLGIRNVNFSTMDAPYGLGVPNKPTDPDPWTGGGVSLGEVELGWGLNADPSWRLGHSYLPRPNQNAATNLINPWSNESPATSCFDQRHGTRTMGVLFGADPQAGSHSPPWTKGLLTGFDKTLHLASVYNSGSSIPGSRIADALLAVGAALNAGDVLLIELQTLSSDLNENYMPIETKDEVYAAIRILTYGLGIAVIEPAGNRGGHLDSYVAPPTSWRSGKKIFVLNGVDVLDSGALMVGGGRWTSAGWTRILSDSRSRNYGQRVDCFAQGDLVSTPSRYVSGASCAESRTETWLETSPAAAIIAGAAVLTQSAYRKKHAGTSLGFQDMRQTFTVSASGGPSHTHTADPQNANGMIGVMPNLASVKKSLNL